MRVDRERIVRYDDGTVIFDPVSGRTRVLACQSVLILSFLAESIAAGTTDRLALLDSLRGELADDGGRLPDLDEATRRRLLDWVDLALHLRS